MDILLTHARLFPNQLRQFLQALGQKVLSLLIGLMMPLLLWLGIGEQAGRAKANPTVGIPEPLLNLIYVNLPAEDNREVPQPTATNRRGLWEKSCPDRERDQLGVETDASSAAHPSVLLMLPDFDGSNLQADCAPAQTVVLAQTLCSSWADPCNFWMNSFAANGLWK
jgi:hypothetical protein